MRSKFLITALVAVCGSLVLTNSAVLAAPKKGVARVSTAEADAQRRGGVRITGCVKQVGACKYIEYQGTKYSAAVKSEVPWLFWLDIPSFTPIPPNTHVVAYGLRGTFSVNCRFSVPDVRGNIVFFWRPTGQVCTQ